MLGIQYLKSFGKIKSPKNQTLKNENIEDSESKVI